MQIRHITACFSLLLVMLLSACAGTGNPIQYYLIDPVASKSLSSANDENLSVEIIDLHIPQYLERFHIATRTSPGRLEFSDDHQWGENLRKNLLRTLSRNLSKLLATNNVGTPLNRSVSSADVRLQVYIEQFELDYDNRIKLTARWQVSDKSTIKPQHINTLEIHSNESVSGSDFDAIVASMRELYGQLSEKIATTILASTVHAQKDS